MYTLTPKQRTALQGVFDGLITSCDESRGDDTSDYQMLYEARLISATNASSFDGVAYMRMRITLLGQTHLMQPQQTSPAAEAIREMQKQQESYAAIAMSFRQTGWRPADVVEVHPHPSLHLMARPVPIAPPVPPQPVQTTTTVQPPQRAKPRSFWKKWKRKAVKTGIVLWALFEFAFPNWDSLVQRTESARAYATHVWAVVANTAPLPTPTAPVDKGPTIVR